jgi:lipopolysaccharide biosynthesis glycosyltransferase
MIVKQILFFLLFFFSCVQTSSIINIVFTVKNLSTNERLKLNFLTMITSLFQHTSIDNLHLHVIGDSDSQQFVDETLQHLNYNHQVIKTLFFIIENFSFLKTNKLNIDDLASKYEEVISPLIQHFSSSHDYYKDPLFFLSPFLYRILPENITRVIMLDIDLRFDNDIKELYKFFDEFHPNQIIGIARENQPVYRHLLWLYRQENPETNIGNPPPYGLTGFNSGVLLLDLNKIRQSILFNNYLEKPYLIKELKTKYHFDHPHLGDQDFYSLLSFEHQDLFFILPCYWNRQLCTWWKGKGYDDVWENYFQCNNEQNISLYHGNCNTEIPRKIINTKVEL